MGRRCYSTASGHKSVGLKHALRDWSHLNIVRSSDSEDEHGHGNIFLLKFTMFYIEMGVTRLRYQHYIGYSCKFDIH